MGAPDGPGRAAVLAALGPEGAPLSVQVTARPCSPTAPHCWTSTHRSTRSRPRFDRGALEVTRGTTVSRFAVLALVRTGSAYRLRVGPGLDAAGARAAPPSSGAAVLLPPPDYGPALADDSLLRTLADLDGNDSAFQLVTVSPLVEPRLTDRFPGRGRNRYLHRVRGVDPAGNRTPMSGTGPPVHLVDLRSPAAPGCWPRRAVAAATLRWRRTRPGSRRLPLHRTIGDDVSAASEPAPDVRGFGGRGVEPRFPPRSDCRSAR